jgi:hypothetical protein
LSRAGEGKGGAGGWGKARQVGPIYRWPREKDKGKGWSGPPGRAGLEEKVGRQKKDWAERGREKEREGGGLLGLAERKGRERVWEVLESFFQTFSNSFFKLLKLNSFSNFKFKLFSKHFNPFQNFQNIFKTFKTSHK